ncbi:hypothetical protein B0H13DRAFT_1855615 [Mycena leptocephala]|nr:hypothetical protein B0H13DRAFT_1855615 [Mycena leptocephala]
MKKYNPGTIPHRNFELSASQVDDLTMDLVGPAPHNLPHFKVLDNCKGWQNKQGFDCFDNESRDCFPKTIQVLNDASLLRPVMVTGRDGNRTVIKYNDLRPQKGKSNDRIPCLSVLYYKRRHSRGVEGDVTYSVPGVHDGKPPNHQQWGVNPPVVQNAVELGADDCAVDLREFVPNDGTYCRYRSLEDSSSDTQEVLRIESLNYLPEYLDERVALHL